MDSDALEKAFEMYPNVKLVVGAELYEFFENIRQIKENCDKHGALFIEDAAEAMGATWKGQQCGSFGDYAAVSYNGNKIITGSSGGCLLTNDLEVANKARAVVGHDAKVGSFCQLKYNCSVCERSLAPDKAKVDCNVAWR